MRKIVKLCLLAAIAVLALSTIAIAVPIVSKNYGSNVIINPSEAVNFAMYDYYSGAEVNSLSFANVNPGSNVIYGTVLKKTSGPNIRIGVTWNCSALPSYFTLEMYWNVSPNETRAR